MSVLRHGFLLLLLAGVGCAHVSVPEDRECERLHARLAYCLLDPSQLAETPERLDRVTVEGPDGRHDFIGQVGFGAERMTLVGQTASGMGLFRIDWDGEQLQQQFRSEEVDLDARRLLALIQLVFASPESLGPAVIGGRVRDSTGEAGRERELLLDNGREVARVRYGQAGDDIHIILGDAVRIRLRPL
jgi:hypothetical protein